MEQKNTETNIALVTKKLCDSAEYIEPTLSEGEFYFEFPAGVFWSITRWESEEKDKREEYSLYLYPLHKTSLEDLVSYAHSLRGNSEEYKTYASTVYPEIFENLRIIHDVIYEKYYGVDHLFGKVLQIESPQEEMSKVIEKQRKEKEERRKKEAEDPPF
jgi:hypothetical protein